MLVLFLLLLVPGTVLAAPGITTDYSGNLYQFWLASTAESSGRRSSTLVYSRSIDQGTTFGQPQALYRFTFEVQACDLKIGPNSAYYIAFEASKESYIISSTDGGKTFAPLFKISGEAYSPSIALDPLGKLHLAYLSEDKKMFVKRLYYTSEVSLEPRAIFESPDEINRPKVFSSPWGIILTWQIKYLNRKETYFTVSLDGGKHFSSIKPLPVDTDIENLVFSGDKWLYFTYSPALANKEIKFTPPLAPELLQPKDKTLIRLSTIEITYRPQSPEPSVTKFELSLFPDFTPERTWVFDQLVFGSPEARYTLPVELPEGGYYLRISAFDGLTTSLPSKVAAFKLDRTAPKITIVSPTAEASEQQLIFLEGEISEPSLLSLNGKKISAEADGKFKVELTLQPGENILTLAATDEAGNSATVSKKLIYSALRPELTILKPKPADWFKPDSAIFIEAAVRDFQNDIEDESEAEIFLNSRLLQDKIIYDRTGGELSGFITLPKDLPDGKNTARVRLRDAAGNLGEKEVKINIDRLPPALNVSSGESVFSNSPVSVIIPVYDAGAGIDPTGTLSKITGVSIEAVSTSESGLKLKVKRPLPDGTYEVTVTPRDLIGNAGQASTFKLTVDTIPPRLTILSTSEPKTEKDRIRIEGEASDSFLSEIKIYLNNKLADSFIPAEEKFSREVLLLPGNNEILVEVSDKAGNKTSQMLLAFADIKSAAAVITNYGNGPNPFSPKSEMRFTYTLTSTADLIIYIFDLSGNLVWKRALGNVAAGYHNDVTWNGINHYGAVIDNGVYPYILQVSSGGTVEIKRGKIIALQ